MTETICPTCGSKCEIRWRIAQRCDNQTCKDLTHRRYNHICPDLTKLREAWNNSGNYSLLIDDKDCRIRYEDLMQAVKELLEEK